jgi:hypothetical protein
MPPFSYRVVNTKSALSSSAGSAAIDRSVYQSIVAKTTTSVRKHFLGYRVADAKVSTLRFSSMRINSPLIFKDDEATSVCALPTISPLLGDSILEFKAAVLD